MKKVFLPDNIVDALEPIALDQRGEFLHKHGLRLPIQGKEEDSQFSSNVASLYTDGASRGNPGKSGAGFYLQDERENTLFEGKKYLGIATNNVAEWTALMLGIEKARELGIQNLKCFLDSELVVKQMNGEYRVKHPELQTFYERVHTLSKSFQSLSFFHIRREYNVRADRLSNEAIDEESKL